MDFGFANIPLEYIATVTEAEFLTELGTPGYDHILSGDPKRTAKLKKAYAVAKKMIAANDERGGDTEK